MVAGTATARVCIGILPDRGVRLGDGEATHCDLVMDENLRLSVFDGDSESCCGMGFQCGCVVILNVLLGRF